MSHQETTYFYSVNRAKLQHTWVVPGIKLYWVSTDKTINPLITLNRIYGQISTVVLFLFRPPDTVVGGLIFYHGFFLLLSSSFFFSPRSMNGTQPKAVTCSEVTAIWKRISKIWSIPSPYKSGAPKRPFWATSQLNGNFNGLHLGTKRDTIDKCVGNHKGSPTSSQNVMNIAPQTAWNWTAILPTLR